jgi:hypothetical protein
MRKTLDLPECFYTFGKFSFFLLLKNYTSVRFMLNFELLLRTFGFQRYKATQFFHFIIRPYLLRFKENLTNNLIIWVIIEESV